MTQPTKPTRLLTPSEYADVLAARKAEYDAEHPPTPGRPTMLSWFIRDGDEDMVDMGAVETANRAAEDDKPPTPRTYRPAWQWRSSLNRVEARMAAINGTGRREGEAASFIGVGRPETARQRARRGAAIDSAAAEYVRLERERRRLHSKWCAALARETNTKEKP